MLKKSIATITLGAVVAGGVTLAMPQKADAAWWATASWKLISYVGDYWYDRAATYVDDPYSTTVSSGTVYFNNKWDSGLGASAKRVVDTARDTDQIDIWAQTNILYWGGYISVIITNSWGRDDISKSVTHNQHIYYTPGYPGSFTVRYVQNSAQGWDLWSRVWKGYNYPTATQSSRQKQGIFEMTRQSDGTRLQAVEGTEGIHLLPSKAHRAGGNIKIQSPLTMAMLFDQLYDKSMNAHVEDFRNYEVGDSIPFTDRIRTLKYEAAKNETMFGFADGHGGVVEWPFSGNLTEQFQVGSELALEFKVVPYDGKFEMLDYIKTGYVNKYQAPSIDPYLAK